MMFAVHDIDPSAELEALLATLEELQFPLSEAHAVLGRETCEDIVHQLEDYIIPRYANADAPLLCVVGGSTGSGKSLLVNSLVGEHVASSSAIRPTTRRPLLVHAPKEATWFSDSRILPHLTRTSVGVPQDQEPATPQVVSEVQLSASSGVPEGVALLDSPDIDSVIEENRRLSGQLLQAADLWIFVTTPARYADAIPWALLDEAAKRNIVVAVVLNRVTPGIGRQIRPDLAKQLIEHGLGSAPLFMISEGTEDSGLIPAQNVEPVRAWLAGLTQDHTSRASVARQTLDGAVHALLERRPIITQALTEQVDALEAMEGDLDESFAQATAAMDAHLKDGSVLRGEVLHRWQEVVGTGEWMRKLETGVATVRDRISGWFSGSPARGSQVEEAVTDSLEALLISQSEQAIARIEASWIDRPESVSVLTAAQMSVRSHEDREEAAHNLVTRWHHDLTEAISATGEEKKSTARILSVGVNVVGAALMIVIFASTAGLTGGEVAVAGGTAVVAQRLLEAVFGEDSVRRMATQARKDLEEKVTAFLGDDSKPFRECLSVLDIDAEAAGRVDDAFDNLAQACERKMP